jgi:hypothetical protein
MIFRDIYQASATNSLIFVRDLKLVYYVGNNEKFTALIANFKLSF